MFLWGRLPNMELSLEGVFPIIFAKILLNCPPSWLYYLTLQTFVQKSAHFSYPLLMKFAYHQYC